MATPDDSQIGTQPCVRRSPAELALAERLLAAARGGADVRARKVRRLRAAIKVKAYENDLKLAVALENMLAALGPGAPAAPETRSTKYAPLSRRSRTIRNDFKPPITE